MRGRGKFNRPQNARLSEPVARISFTSRYAIELSGGIETFVAEVVPRLQRRRSDWNVRAVHAFARVSAIGRLPLVCDLVAGVILAWRTRGDDVTVINGAEYAFARMLVPRLRRRTIVVWHGTRAAEIPSLTPRMSLPIRLYAFLERGLQRVAFAAPIHVAVGDSVGPELLAAYGRAPELRIVHNGAPPAVASAVPPAQSPTVLWIGSNAYKKGLDIALETCRLARRGGADVRLVVAGLSERIDPVEPWIHDLGIVDRGRMNELFDEAAVVLMTTRYEACSMAVLEAMARRKAVVASPAVAWMFDEPGKLRDAPAFAAAILDALTPIGRAKLEERSLRSLRRFDWEYAIDAYEASIDRLLRSRAPGEGGDDADRDG
jgi:glycosyltransferase involved in cell wall biosynthesis